MFLFRVLVFALDVVAAAAIAAFTGEYAHGSMLVVIVCCVVLYTITQNL